MPDKNCKTCSRSDCSTRNDAAPFEHCQRWEDAPAPLAVAVPSVALVPFKGASFTVTGQVSGVKTWLDRAGMFEAGKVFCQVMAGFELAQLWKAAGVVHGNNQHGRTSQNGKSSEGEEPAALSHDQIADQLGQSKTQLYRYMEMARACAKRLKKLPALKGLDLVTTPITALSDEQREAMASAVKKLTDRTTQREFGEAMGLWKKVPTGGGNKPGHGGRPPGPGTPSAALAARQKMAREDVAIALRSLATLGDKWHFLGAEDEVSLQALVSALEKQAQAIKSWLATPAAKRVAEVKG